MLIDQLTSAILGSRVARVASLLRRGVPVNGADKYGTTPLYKAAVQGETEIVRVLLEAGADPNLESGGQDEGTPLCAAASWGRTEVVRLLLQHGADPNAVETKERGPMTALAWAQHGGYAEVVDLLVEAGAHPSKYERSGGVHGKAWDLRVACALVSLDIVEPFLVQLGFRTDDTSAVRQAARAYLADWPIDDRDAWLASARQTYGKPGVDRLAQLSDELATRQPNNFAWTALFVKLADGPAKLSGPGLDQAKLAWLRKAARAYLAESDDLDTRMDALDSAKRSDWDLRFLAEAFYPAGYESDPAVHFDPRAWLWAWLHQKQWQKFRDQMRSKLSAREIDELVSWGKGVIEPRSVSLSDAM